METFDTAALSVIVQVLLVVAVLYFGYFWCVLVSGDNDEGL